MGQIRVSVLITGTDENGDDHTLNLSGQFHAAGAHENTLTCTTTKQDIVSAVDEKPSWVYIENYGTVDVALGMQDANGITLTFAIPPGSATIVPAQVGTRQCVESIKLWTAASTASAHYILFY